MIGLLQRDAEALLPGCSKKCKDLLRRFKRLGASAQEVHFGADRDTWTRTRRSTQAERQSIVYTPIEFDNVLVLKS
jgi:hypothetical protein